MTAPPRRSMLLTALLTVGALLAGTVGAGADEIGDKQAEAEEVAGRLADQAREIVALDKEHRAAQDRLGQTEVALDQAETELVGASLRQEDARRLLVAHAQAAYVSGGSVSFVGNLANGAAPDGVARNTYLRFVTGEDRQAVGRMRAAREDLEIRRAQLDAARRRAADQADVVGGDLEELQHAMTAQRAQVARIDGELSTLVAAEQAQVAEAARQQQALRDAEAAAARAAARAAPPPPPGGRCWRRHRSRRPVPPCPWTRPSPASASWSRATTTRRPAAGPTSSSTTPGSPSATRGRPRTIPRRCRTRAPAASRPAAAGASGRSPPSAASSDDPPPAELVTESAG